MDDANAALRAGDQRRLAVIRLARAEIKNAEIDRGRELGDAEIVSVLRQLLRQTRETLETATTAGRSDLAQRAEAEVAVLAEYLPQQISRDEIVAVARKAIADVGAAGPRDMGRVMGPLLASLGARAEAREVSAVVQELLKEG